MIAQIKGQFLELSPTKVIVDAGGVGYELHISLHTYSAIQGKTEGRLFTFLKISEDSHTLYGFAEQEEKNMFTILISVSGVGAATARMMLSSLKPDEISSAILSGDSRQLERVKGIGKKTAERLVLELKDKIGKVSGENQLITTLKHNTIWTDALEALQALGIARLQAESGVKKVQSTQPDLVSVENIIKQVLKAI
jgi:Holliday junction DNA helicase RuvA